MMRVALLPQLAQLAQTVVGHDLAAKIPAVVGHEDLARDVDHQVHPAVVAVEEDVRRVGDESSEHRHTLFRQTGDFDFTVGNRKSLAHIDEMILQTLEELPHLLAGQTAVDDRHLHTAQLRRASHARFDLDHLLRDEVEQTTDLLLDADRLVALEWRGTHFQVDGGGNRLVSPDGDDVAWFHSRKEGRINEQDGVGKGGGVEGDGLLPEIVRSGGYPVIDGRFCIETDRFVLLEVIPI